MKNALLISVLLTTALVFGQTCDCKKNFEWVKQTFEENDAGFSYALQQKGTHVYEIHTKQILKKVKSAKTLQKCTPILYEWLTFFRSGHIAIRLNEQQWSQASNKKKTENNFSNWETYPIDISEFKSYLDNNILDYEGIWETEPYKIGIKKEGDKYIGFIIESGATTWTKGQVKLKFDVSGEKANAVFYRRDHSAVETDVVTLIGKNHLQIGNFNLVRIYPQLVDEPKFEQYFKMLDAQTPYMEQLNETTLYFRIPSFQAFQKQAIDSVIRVNRDKILTTENLIIDIRNGTGGSDVSFNGLLPFIYTNPIRTVSVEYLSTTLNNQRMLDFITNPDYEFDEEDKKWAKESFEKLDKQQGQFVNVDDEDVTVTKFDTVYTYPKNVGIIINQQNGSTDEQFLLSAKQSKKVKLFGTTTFGVLDVSNMYFVPSPCNEFQLGYALSRSMRIPDFTIDEKGIQPDFYLDKSIPLYEWVEYVDEVLNGK
ncbi:MAG TPA: S41 family peptidase [Crocinitomicaceae bacterium]|nr:S41 family peptidase [Crocinitomicaceae bacterium]